MRDSDAVIEAVCGPLPVPHLVTLRGGGVSAGPYTTLNVGGSVGDDPSAVAENRRRAADAMGVPVERVATVTQVHGARVVEAGVDHHGAEADAVIGADPWWVLAVGAADCLPVLLHDAGTGAVAAVHAGWRGTAIGVVGAVVRAMVERFGTDPSQTSAWLGPAIAGRCYQVGPDVAEALEASWRAVGGGSGGAAVRPDPAGDGRFLADLAALVRAQLLAEGLAPGAVSDAGVCTHCDPRCFSHRRDGPATGRHWAMIAPAR